MALSVAPPGPHLVPPVARAASSGSRAPARGALGGAPGQLLLGVCGFSVCGALRRSSARSAVQRRARLEKRVIQESPYLDEKPYEGDLVRIHYVGRLSDGTCFDNSRVRGKPFEFVMGESEVIDGWEILISTMALKEKAELTCPPQYAYGDDGVPPYVPPGETVTFTVDLLDIGRPVQEEEKPVVDVSEDEEDEDENFWDKDEQREKGRCLGFNWEASGSGQEIFVRVPLSDDVRVKEIKVNITSTAIKCKIADQMVIEGTLFAPVLTDDSFWDFEKKGKKARNGTKSYKVILRWWTADVSAAGPLAMDLESNIGTGALPSPAVRHPQVDMRSWPPCGAQTWRSSSHRIGQWTVPSNGSGAVQSHPCTREKWPNIPQ